MNICWEFHYDDITVTSLVSNTATLPLKASHNEQRIVRLTFIVGKRLRKCHSLWDVSSVWWRAITMLESPICSWQQWCTNYLQAKYANKTPCVDVPNIHCVCFSDADALLLLTLFYHHLSSLFLLPSYSNFPPNFAFASPPWKLAWSNRNFNTVCSSLNSRSSVFSAIWPT